MESHRVKLYFMCRERGAMQIFKAFRKKLLRVEYNYFLGGYTGWRNSVMIKINTLLFWVDLKIFS
jgi:hypothetical protein